MRNHASRVSQVIAAVAKVSCKHGLWLVARVNKKPPSSVKTEDESIIYFVVPPHFTIVSRQLPRQVRRS